MRFVELAAVSAADLMAPAIAAGLGLNTSAGQLTADLEAYLRPRRLLLAVDNFEQVLAAAPLLAGLLAAAPGLVVLVTSRAVLRLSGEHEFAVPPLPVPPAGVADPEQLRRYASVSLFTERAHAADTAASSTNRTPSAKPGPSRPRPAPPGARPRAPQRRAHEHPHPLIRRADHIWRRLGNRDRHGVLLHEVFGRRIMRAIDPDDHCPEDQPLPAIRGR